MYTEKYRLDGKTAFVTGGGRGIGLATAEALLEFGARVVISDHNADILAAGAAHLATWGDKIDTVVLDVTKPNDVERVAAEANAKYGAIDILIANAGIAWPDTPGEAIPDDVWLRIIDVDLNGVYWSCRAFAGPMLERGRGSIVTLGSMSGLISNKPQRQAHYNAAKAGVHQLTKSLGGEWATRGVRVNSVAPTYVETAMTKASAEDATMLKTWMEFTPMNRMARPDEIASAILFLASDAASAMTGTTLVVDCGYTIW